MIPRLSVPLGACDTHVHILEADAVVGLAVKPEIASLADYRRQRERLGVARTVLVQPSAFKFDNTGVLAALADLGQTARAVVTVERSISETELRRLTQLGVRGARFHLLKSPLQSWEDLEPIANRVAAHGWHVQLQCDGRQLPERAAMLSRLPGTLVIDQTGKFLEPVTVDDPAFHALLDLVEQGRTYVKLSAPYEVSKAGPPAYADVSILAEALVRAAPDRMLWASNWPHHSLPVGKRPHDAELMDLLLDWAPDAELRRRILVDNPARLYGFTCCKD
jgi:D-galactarolactone isomerase